MNNNKYSMFAEMRGFVYTVSIYIYPLVIDKSIFWWYIGVDWKSLTIPACLPITTDYFPDKRSLQNDYVVSDYNLLPDDVNADFAQQRAIYKKPLTTAEVFRELVSQRLAQVWYILYLSYHFIEYCHEFLKFLSSIPPTNVWIHYL